VDRCGGPSEPRRRVQSLAGSSAEWLRRACDGAREWKGHGARHAGRRVVARTTVTLRSRGSGLEATA
jgi:hypothetical protein